MEQRRTRDQDIWEKNQVRSNLLNQAINGKIPRKEEKSSLIQRKPKTRYPEI